MNDSNSSNKKDDIDRKVEKLQKLLTSLAGHDPDTCPQEQQAKIERDDKGGIKLVSFASGSEYQINEQIKMFILLRFFAAVENRDLNQIKNLVEKNLVDINAKTPMPESPIKPTTALNIAINQENSEEIVKYLIANGAGDDAVNSLGDGLHYPE